MCACMRACVRACARLCVCCVRVPMFSNDYCIVLGYDSGVSRTIVGNMVTRPIFPPLKGELKQCCVMPYI